MDAEGDRSSRIVREDTAGVRVAVSRAPQPDRRHQASILLGHAGGYKRGYRAGTSRNWTRITPMSTSATSRSTLVTAGISSFTRTGEAPRTSYRPSPHISDWTEQRHRAGMS